MYNLFHKYVYMLPVAHNKGYNQLLKYLKIWMDI